MKKNNDVHFQTELNEWLKTKDYSIISSWTVGELLEQVEQRLDLVEHACLNRGFIDNDIRWKMLEKNQLFLKGFVSRRSITTFETEYCEPLTRSSLAILSALVLNNQKHSNQVFRHEYAHETFNETLGVTVFIPLSNASDKELLKDFSSLLPQLRNKLKIQEPEPFQKRFPLKDPVKSFINCRVIEYLDIIIYIVKTLQLEERPKKPTVIATSLNITKSYEAEYLGSNDISIWERDFYSSSLFNPEWIKFVMTSLHSNSSFMSTNVLRAII